MPLDILLPIALGVAGVSFVGALKAANGKNGKNHTHPHDFSDGVLLEIRVPRGNEKDALAAEQVFAALHGLLRPQGPQEHLSFELVGDASGIKFYVWTPKHIREFVEGQIYAQYPAAELSEVPDYTTNFPLDVYYGGEGLSLAKASFFPIKTFREFEVDPLASLTGAMTEMPVGDRVAVQIILRPIPDIWQAEGHAYVNQLREGLVRLSFAPMEMLKAVMVGFADLIPAAVDQFMRGGKPRLIDERTYRPSQPRLSSGDELAVKAIEEKLTRIGFECSIRILAGSQSQGSSEKLLRGVSASFDQFSTAHLNAFGKVAPRGSLENFRRIFASRTFPSAEAYILDTAELASLWHLPHISVETPGVLWSAYKKGEPPLNLALENCVYIGETAYREHPRKFGIKREDRRRHLYVVGKTGTGKSTLFKNMIIQDIRDGEGVGVFDPHGDLAEDLLNFVPEQRLEDVVYFDPADADYPIGLNLLEIPDPSQKNLLASGLLDAFKKHFEDISWGPRLEYLLNNAILTLLEVPGTTILGIVRILTDKNYQKYITYGIRDPVLKEFWEKEYAQMMANPKLFSEAVAPIQNKVGRFLAPQTIRNILGQRNSSLDLEDVINNGKIFLVNLSKGKIGEDNANLLGSLLISRLNFMAMRRVAVAEEERKDFFLYADEFQNFASGSFASILSEARKYRLCLNLTHQYIAQLPETMVDAVFGNIGTIITFSLGSQDALVMEKEFTPYFTADDLISLEKYHMYVKLMVDGMTSKPFSAVALPPPSERHNLKERAVDLSRGKYGRNREEVEGKIERWSQKQFSLGMAISEERVEGGSEVSNPPTADNDSNNSNQSDAVTQEAPLVREEEQEKL